MPTSRTFLKFGFRISWVALLVSVTLVVVALPAWLWYRRWQARVAGELAVAQMALRQASEQEEAAEEEEAKKEEKPFVYPPFDADWWRQVIRDETRVIRAAPPRPAVSAPFRLTSISRPIDAPGELPSDWAFRRLQPVSPPSLGSSWIRNPIDGFILQSLQKRGLKPNDDADRRTTARRLWLGLTGIPPTPGELWEFVSTEDPRSYETTVEQLLERPDFGEHWATFWLDLARYADSNGYEEDELKPYAFPYRDFVIWAMNVDLPYDQFLRWQIAGDELAPTRPMALAATGFFTNAPYNSFIPQKSERMDELDDMLTTFGRTMLGMTVGCARCHDHPYDDISTEEYYRMVAIFNGTTRKHRFLATHCAEDYERRYAPIEELHDAIIQMLIAKRIDDRIESLDFTAAEKDLLREPLDPDNEQQQRLLASCMRCTMVTELDVDLDMEPLERDRARFEATWEEYQSLLAALPPMPPRGLTLAGSAVNQQAILERGNLAHAGDLVGPGFLALASARPVTWTNNEWLRWSEGAPQPRSALARWLTDIEEGAGSLAARVIVNRLWQHHFGEPLVRTPSDFGAHGDTPSHPQLLDWLAYELVSHDWSLKHIHRLIVTSSTYRQSIQITSQAWEQDPLNRLFGRRTPRRMTAEMLHDSMLTAAGALNHEMYGRSVIPPIPQEAIYNTQDSPAYTWPAEAEGSDQLKRRGVYTMKKRTIPVPWNRLFDATDGTVSCEQRKQTTIPTQALALLNGDFARRQARRMTKRLLDSHPDATRQTLIKHAFLITFSREPDATESQQAIAFLDQQSEEGSSTATALTELCHVLMMTNEFLYYD